MAAKKRAIAGEEAAPRIPELPRKRRAPEEAKALLLDAAERLFFERGPDAVGLRDVAREAGVSHGLITHYFKTYEGLVESVLGRRTARIAERVVTRFAEMQQAPSANELVDLLLAIVSEPIHLKLVAWAMLSGRAQQADFVPGRPMACDRSLKRSTRLRATRPRLGAHLCRRAMTSTTRCCRVGSAYGGALEKRRFLAALGRKGSARTDER